MFRKGVADNIVPLHEDCIRIAEMRNWTKLLRAKYERTFLCIMLADFPRTSFRLATSSAIWPALRNTLVLPICDMWLAKLNTEYRSHKSPQEKFNSIWHLQILRCLSQGFAKVQLISNEVMKKLIIEHILHVLQNHFTES